MKALVIQLLTSGSPQAACEQFLEGPLGFSSPGRRRL